MNAQEMKIAEQRQMLSRQLQAQRELIGQELDPIAGMNRQYPRSITMRLLVRHPVLVIRAFRWLTVSRKAR